MKYLIRHEFETAPRKWHFVPKWGSSRVGSYFMWLFYGYGRIQVRDTREKWRVE